jgi:hypothetical protein
LNDFVAALIATAGQQRLKAIEAENERQQMLATEREREAAARQRAARWPSWRATSSGGCAPGERPRRNVPQALRAGGFLVARRGRRSSE